MDEKPVQCFDCKSTDVRIVKDALDCDMFLCSCGEAWYTVAQSMAHTARYRQLRGFSNTVRQPRRKRKLRETGDFPAD